MDFQGLAVLAWERIQHVQRRFNFQILIYDTRMKIQRTSCWVFLI